MDEADEWRQLLQSHLVYARAECEQLIEELLRAQGLVVSSCEVSGSALADLAKEDLSVSARTSLYQLMRSNQLGDLHAQISQSSIRRLQLLHRQLDLLQALLNEERDPARFQQHTQAFSALQKAFEQSIKGRHIHQSSMDEGDAELF
ncbi:hypothetical protein [Simiduia agarivorans]|uniref:Uncharacterized protein n=1 Tax=Simiduia agarivorans (strain DSM 21679 / JCM 13881 / BCRC 17597 / SA1) TaxID=1117647 RepID=K4KE59_SIMAS|nr:hypothetical protein [Simiduia agarivorans]AFU97324.1 hypothetical protein M5M_00435 [Simiduia agarivorans SA1 = DSM 21679]